MDLYCELHSQKKYGNGYQLYLTVYDMGSGKRVDVLGNQSVYVGDKQLLGDELTSYIDDVFLSKTEALLSKVVEHNEMMFKSDFVQLLRDKNYLTDKQSLEDLLDKEVV